MRYSSRLANPKNIATKIAMSGKVIQNKSANGKACAPRVLNHTISQSTATKIKVVMVKDLKDAVQVLTELK